MNTFPRNLVPVFRAPTKQLLTKKMVLCVNGNFTQLISLMIAHNLSKRNKCFLSDSLSFCIDFELEEKWSGIFVCFILIQQIKGKSKGEKPIFIPSGILESQP